MSIRYVLLCTCIITAITTSPGVARVSFDVDIGVPPPAPYVEVAPEARPGFVWIPGYWGWNGAQHIWVNGRWVEDRPGYYWVPEGWEHRGERWHFNHGYWARREHDRRWHDR